MSVFRSTDRENNWNGKNISDGVYSAHLKALLTFSRKWLRDKNPHYLQHIPRTLRYIEQSAARYDELQTFHLFLTESILPAMKRVTLCVE